MKWERFSSAILLAAFALLAAACGSDGSGTASAELEPATQDANSPNDEDHEGEDHDDEDHEGEDHEGEDHEGDDHEGDDHEGEDHDDEDHSSGGLGAHEHGAAELTVAWAGSDMVIDFISPTFNVFGFEYEPETEADLAVVDAATGALTAPGVLTVNPEAGCRLASEPTTETEFEGSHAEITASWKLTCDSPEEIEELDAAGLFAEFGNLEDVDVQWVSDAGQSAAELTPSSTTLKLK